MKHTPLFYAKRPKIRGKNPFLLHNFTTVVERLPSFQENITSDTINSYNQRKLARKYSASADYEELVSDGMQALISAVSEYNSAKGSFKAFAAVCIAICK